MKKTKSIIAFLVLTLIALTITACGSQQASAPNPQTPIEDNNMEETIIPEEIKIEHELGETTIEGKPSKVIVFDYGILDAMDTIGEDIIGLPKATLPNYLHKYSGDNYVDVGTLKEPNFEKIYELSPDLIIISGRQATLYEEFVKIAPTVYLPIDGSDYINSFKHNMDILGKIFHKEDIVKEKIGEIEKAIDELNKQATSSDLNSLFVMANDGSLSVYGSDSRFGILHKEFGVKPVDESIESSDHGQKISYEYIVEKDPDYLFVLDRAAVVGGETSASKVMENDLMEKTKAYNNDRIIYLDSHVWYVSSGGITGTLKMVEDIQSALNK